MTTFEQTFEELPLAGVHDLAAARHADGWRYVQILAVIPRRASISSTPT